MRFPNAKRLAPLLAFAKQEGFEVARTRNGHLKFTKPGYPPVFTSSTPSDHRAIKNTLAQLRRLRPRRLTPTGAGLP